MAYQPLVVLQHTTIGLGRLAQQYKNKSNIASLITAMMSEVQTLEQVFNDLFNLRMLPNSGAGQAGASGAQLDRLGRLLGVRRAGLSDASYLVRLRAQITINIGSGTALDLFGIVDPILAATFPSAYSVLEEQFPAGLSLKVYGTNITTAADLAAVLKIAKDGGVRLVVEYATDTDANAFTLESVFSAVQTATLAGATSLPLASATGFPSSGSIVIAKGTAVEETVAYSAVAGNTLTVAAMAFAHPAGDAVQLAGTAGAGTDASNVGVTQAAAAGATTMTINGGTTFPAGGGTIILAKGTTVEETIVYVSFNSGTSQFSFAAPGLAFAHPAGDAVQLSTPAGGKLAGAY